MKLNKFNKVLDEVGVPVKSSLELDTPSSLPILYRKKFSYSLCNLKSYDKDLMLVFVNDDEWDVNELVSNFYFLADWFDEDVILIFNELISFNKKQLINLVIPFVNLGGEVYLPFMGAYLKKDKPKLEILARPFTVAEQIVYLHVFYLKRNNIINIIPKYLIETMGLSQPTIYRCLDVLAKIGIFELGEDRNHSEWLVNISLEKMWETGKILLRSPVREILVVDKEVIKEFNEKDSLSMSSFSALSHYTNLQQTALKTFAFLKKEIKESNFLLNKLSVSENASRYALNRTDDFITVEVWNYMIKRELFDNIQGDENFEINFIDPISLYISMQDTKDPRVLSELDSLIMWVVSE